MERQELEQLAVWKTAKGRKPLIIRGARQVGKTWLMTEFARKEFKKSAYVNFESSAVMKNLFAHDLDVRRILQAIEIETGVSIEAGNTLIILDEIQEVAGGLSSLKYFQENAPEYHVICAGSLLGVALNNTHSFPVGKVEFMDLHPLNFSEFLEAIGQESLLEPLKNKDWTLIKAFRYQYAGFLKKYYYVGGMPEAVLSFSEKGDVSAVRDIQKRILVAYEQDFSKHAPSVVVPRIRMLWNAVPSQLAKENKKFIYGLIKQGSRAKEYEMAMSWLIDAGLIHRVTRVSKPTLPLKVYEDISAFKLFLVDIGLLCALVDLDAKVLLDNNRLLEEFKGSLTEQYILQECKTQKDVSVFYWSADTGMAEIDFLLQIAGRVIPVEVKAEENLKSKSLKVFSEKFHPPLVIRTSMSDFRQESWMTNLPLYAFSQIKGLSEG